MSIVLVGSTSGSCTLQEQAVAGNTVLTLPTTSGTLLTTGSPQSGGVIQVVQGTSSTATTTTNTTYQDTTLTATITPKFSTSKILVMVSQATTLSQNGLVYYGDIRLVRNSTTIYSGANVSGYLTNCILNVAGTSATSGQNTFMFNVQYLDTPSTTSATTYKTQQATPAAAFSIGTQIYSPSFITLLEIAQ